MEKGKAEGPEQVAESLLAFGMPIEQLSQVVGLPLERIKALPQP